MLLTNLSNNGQACALPPGLYAEQRHRTPQVHTSPASQPSQRIGSHLLE